MPACKSGTYAYWRMIIKLWIKSYTASSYIWCSWSVFLCFNNKKLLRKLPIIESFTFVSIRIMQISKSFRNYVIVSYTNPIYSKWLVQIIIFVFNYFLSRYIVRKSMSTWFCSGYSNIGTKTKRVSFNIAIYQFLFKEVCSSSTLAVCSCSNDVPMLSFQIKST